MSQLRHLTELLCEPETFRSVEELCPLSNMNFRNLCEESALHVQLLEAAELSTEIATSLLYNNIISKKLKDLLTGDPIKINLNMDRYVFPLSSSLAKSLLKLLKWRVQFPPLFCSRFLEQALQMNYLENITRLIPAIEATLHVNHSADTSEKPGVSLSVF